MSMDEARLAEIERDVTDALKSYEGFPYPTNGMRAIVTTAIPDMITEIRRCWLVIDASEKAGIKLAGDIKTLLETMVRLMKQSEEKDQRIAELETELAAIRDGNQTIAMRIPRKRLQEKEAQP